MEVTHFISTFIAFQILFIYIFFFFYEFDFQLIDQLRQMVSKLETDRSNYNEQMRELKSKKSIIQNNHYLFVRIPTVNKMTAYSQYSVTKNTQKNEFTIDTQCDFIIPSPTKLRRDIVTLPSFRNILVNTLESISFNGFWPNLVYT